MTFLSNPVNKAQLLIRLTLWTFSVDSYMGRMQHGKSQHAVDFPPLK